MRRFIDKALDHVFVSVSSYLDLVRVHAGVGDQDLDVLHPLGLVHSDLLVQQETWTEQTPCLPEPIGNQRSES